MTTQTAKYQIAYPQLVDTIASLASTCQNLAQRVDLLLGESGTWNPSMTAGTAISTPITLARTYPGNALAGAPPGVVIVQAAGAMGAGASAFAWVLPGSWVGSAATVTGFTLNAISSTTASRLFYWRFLPVL